MISAFVLFTMSLKVKEKESIIPDSAIRFRVIANSNTAYDQNIKIQIRNLIQNKILELTKDTSSIKEVRKILLEHKEELYELTKDKLKNLGYDKKFTRALYKALQSSGLHGKYGIRRRNEGTERIL